MSAFEICLLCGTVLITISGGWAIFWARVAVDPGRRLWGRRLFVATLLLFAASALVAAWHKADGLVPLGLSAGFLVIGMLWENPGAAARTPQPEPAVDAFLGQS